MHKTLLITTIFLGAWPLCADAQELPTAAPPGVRSLLPSLRSLRGMSLQQVAPSGGPPTGLRQAVEIALERNPLLEVERLRFEQAEQRVTEERGAFDPLFSIEATTGRKDNVVASRFYPTGQYVDEQRGYVGNVEGRTFFGGRFTIGADVKRLESTSNTQTLSPQYSAISSVNFTQPLLRDFGNATTARIRVAQKGVEVARLTVAQRVGELIQQVEEAYWTTVFLRRDLEDKRASLDLAKELVARNETLVRAGLLAPVGVSEARAAVSAREDAFIQAETEVAKQEDHLRVLLHSEFADSVPVSLDAVVQEAGPVDLAASLRTAMAKRPELLSLQQEREQRRIEEEWASNQTRPRLDVTAQLGTSGLAGQPNPTCVDPNAFFCTPVGENLIGSIFEGRSTLGQAYAHQHGSWSIGLKMQRPLNNSAAKAQLAQASLATRDADSRILATRDRVEAEVRAAVRDTLAAERRLAAAGQVVAFAEEQLIDGRSKLEAGLAASYEVLQWLDERDRARTTEARAMSDYNVGRGRIRLTEGTLLEKYNVEITGLTP